MKKIRTITFHSSYNFGSNLQAYALQEFIKKLYKKNNKTVDYKIINLRTNKQDDMYKYSNRGIKNNIINVLYGKKMKKRQSRFEDFYNKYLDMTREYKSLEELKKENIQADYFISGSDQLWNIRAHDFDWANFIEFSEKGKKISYAASFGEKEIEFTQNEKDRIKEDLQKYENISVRDEYAYNIVKNLLNKNPIINVDPTMLLSIQEWTDLANEIENVQKGEYLLLYSLNLTDEKARFVYKLAKKLDLKVVVMSRFFKLDTKYHFIKKYDASTIEFLNLIKNAKCVITSSFHGTIFSILFHKPFYSINGNNDYRISRLLKLTDLLNRAININDDIDLLEKEMYNIVFEKVDKAIENEILKSEEYLTEALKITD